MSHAGKVILAVWLADQFPLIVCLFFFTPGCGPSKRYFGSADAQHLLEDPHTVIQGDQVLHLRYRVRRTAAEA